MAKWTVLLIFSSFIAFPFQLEKFVGSLGGCYTVSFLQKEEFSGHYDIYKGILKKRGRKVEVVYSTSPPFKVLFDGRLVRMGYEGEEFQTFDPKDYPNPVLEILLNLDRLDRIFEVLSCKGNVCILKPKREELSEYLREVRVSFDKKGYPEKIEADGGEYGKLEIEILRLSR